MKMKLIMWRRKEEYVVSKVRFGSIFTKLKLMVWTRLNASIVRNLLVENKKMEPSICGSIMRFVFSTRFL